MEPFLGEIRLFAMDREIDGWLPCEGQLLPINQNQALYAILGTTYGGNGINNFQLPDLRGKVPVHPGGGFGSIGNSGGEETHILTVNEIPKHSHNMSATDAQATSSTPDQSVWAVSSDTNLYAVAPGNVVLSNEAIKKTGSNTGHSNMQPYIVLKYYIAIIGIFPTRN